MSKKIHEFKRAQACNNLEVKRFTECSFCRRAPFVEDSLAFLMTQSPLATCWIAAHSCLAALDPSLYYLSFIHNAAHIVFVLGMQCYWESAHSCLAALNPSLY